MHAVITPPVIRKSMAKVTNCFFNVSSIVWNESSEK